MSERLSLILDKMPTKLFPAQFEYLDAIRDYAAEAARKAGMDDKGVYNLQLVVDEAASNIIEHAYEGIADGKIEITLEATSKVLTIVMHDHGKRFNEDEVGEPDLEAVLEDRAVGGLGLFFMRKLMDEVRFEWDPGHGNVLKMTKFLKPGQKAIKKTKRQTRPNPEKIRWVCCFFISIKILSSKAITARSKIILK